MKVGLEHRTNFLRALDLVMYLFINPFLAYIITALSELFFTSVSPNIGYFITSYFQPIFIILSCISFYLTGNHIWGFYGQKENIYGIERISTLKWCLYMLKYNIRQPLKFIGKLYGIAAYVILTFIVSVTEISRHIREKMKGV